jgi:DNA polymerase-3 subunit delta'
VVIGDPADDMNISAANALLKNLEEPPPRTIFILIAHSLGRLLPTIRSRCQVLKLDPLPAARLEELLLRLGAEMPAGEGERQLLIDRAAGSARDAILLTQFGGLEIEQVIDQILQKSRFEVSEASRLAEATTGRERQVQFDLFNRAVLDRVALAASQAAAAGTTSQAARLASLWEELSETIRQVEIFNLDRRQHVVGLLARLHQAMREAVVG